MIPAVPPSSESASSGSGALPELRFVRPMPGFADLSRFVLVALTREEDADGQSGAGGEPAPDVGTVLYELRSLEQPQVRFLVGVPGAFFSDYEVELDDDTCSELGLTDADDALVLVVLTLGAEPTANLLAPVVINGRTRAAAQVILSGSDWPVRAAVA